MVMAVMRTIMIDNGEKLIMHTEKMKTEDIVKKITEYAKVRMSSEGAEMPMHIEHRGERVCVYVLHLSSSGIRMTDCMYVSCASS